MHILDIKEINFGLRFNRTYLGLRYDERTRHARILYRPCSPESADYREIVRVYTQVLGRVPTPGEPFSEGVHTLELYY